MDSSFPEGTGNVWLDNVGCTGTEEKLVDCPFNTVGNNSCGHSEDASVRCGMLIELCLQLFFDSQSQNKVLLFFMQKRL